MKLKNSYFFTLRENVKDEDSRSSNLLVRAGMIKKSSSGVYMMLPLGLKVIRKIEKIIREEMDRTGCQELLMPCMIPEEIYTASGRRAGFGASMFSFKDRGNKNYVLGPTHEELFAIAAKMQIQSYKDMCQEKLARCIFEYIYFARPDAVIDGVGVYASRIKAGRFLAMDSPVEADMVVGVPESGNPAAQGYAMESGIPYGTAFIKNSYVGRTFIKPKQSMNKIKGISLQV